MLYFDPDFLSQYLTMGKDIKVFVDDEYLSIADESDIEDSMYGVGYRVDGSPETFDYRNITQIKTGENILTLDALQSKVDGTEPEGGAEGGATDDMAADAAGGDMGGDAELAGLMGDEKPAPDGEAPPEEQPEKEESYRSVMTNMINESRSKPTALRQIKTGMLVENVDTHSAYHGSRGIVIKVNPTSQLVGYRATVEGKNNKLAEILYAKFDELREI